MASQVSTFNQNYFNIIQAAKDELKKLTSNANASAENTKGVSREWAFKLQTAEPLLFFFSLGKI